MIRIAGTVSKGWMAQAVDVAFDRDYYFDPIRRQAVDARCNAYLRDQLGELDLLFTESNLGRREHYDDRQALVGGIQPNMIFGLLVGAEFVPNDRMDADISPTPLAGVEPGDLPTAESLLEHPLVRRFDDQYRQLAGGGREGDRSMFSEEASYQARRQRAEKWTSPLPPRERLPDLVPVPPLFWDGSSRAAIHGTLTTAQKLFGQSILLDLIADPARAESILRWVDDVSIALVRHFANLGGRKIAEVHVGECSACMVRAETFERFLVPSLSRSGRELGSVRLHSCGASDHLLPGCRGIENLGSLDLGGETSVATARRLLGSEIPMDVAPLVEDLRAATPDALLAWARRVAAENGAGPLTVVYHLEQGYNLQHLRALHDCVAALGG